MVSLSYIGLGQTFLGRFRDKKEKAWEYQGKECVCFRDQQKTLKSFGRSLMCTCGGTLEVGGKKIQQERSGL